METFLQQLGAQFEVILILALSFIILVLILSKFLFKPIIGYLDQRNNEIKHTFDEIEKGKGDITALKDKYEQQLSSIEKAAYEKTQAAIKEGLALKTEIVSEAHSQADIILRKASGEIEMEKKKAIAELKTEIVNLSLEAAGRVIEKKMDETANQKIVEQFLYELDNVKDAGKN